MIRITHRGGDHVVLSVSGHAGSAPHGEDLVCAAVSALCETLALGLERFDPQGKVELGEGAFRYEGDPDPLARAVLETFVAGLRDLASSQPKFVRFDAKE